MNDRRSTTVHDQPAFTASSVPPASSIQMHDERRQPPLGEVLFLSLEAITKVPLGYLNLVCATMLPDSADLDIPLCMRTLSQWTALVQWETERQMPRFRGRPYAYNNSEAYFRMLVLISVLQRDLGVKYDADCIRIKQFRCSREGFIHGLLTGDRTGSCANMPVLYAAIGRNLGYPLYLVAAKGHLFCRWHSIRTGERFNVEGSGRGFCVHPDDYYMNWPRPITEQEVFHGIYLRNLDPVEELAFFMATRGHCLRDKGHHLDAIVAYAHAHRLAPTDPVCMFFLLTALNKELELHHEGKLPASYRQAEAFPHEDSLLKMKFVIDDRYGERVAGVNVDESQPLHLLVSES